MDVKYFVRIKERRQSKGFTQKQLAEAASISPTSLIAYEKGAKTPPVDVAARIAKCLDVSIDWLFGLEENAETVSAKSDADLIKAFLLLSEAGIHIEMSCESVYWQDDPNVDDFEASDYMAEEHCAEQIGESVKSVTVDYAVFRVRYRPLAKFFDSWSKLYKLYNNGDIDTEMYHAWIDKRLTEAKENALPQWVTPQILADKNPDTK